MITLSELAQKIGGRIEGDGQVELSGAARLDLAGPTDITLADHPDRARDMARSQAGAVVAAENVPCGDKPRIVVEDARAAFAAAVAVFRPSRRRSRGGVSPHAIVSKTARLASDVEIHPKAVIGDDVIIENGATIHAGASIMPGCSIGKDTTIFPNVVLYEQTRIGARCILHAGVVIGAYGFGYQSDSGKHILSDQLGYVEIGDDVEIGAGSTIDRGTYGPTTIGTGTKIDNLVMVAHNCQIGRHNLLCSQVGIAGSTTTGDHVVMAGQVGVRDHVTIGDRAVLASQAGIANDVAGEETMLGSPATPIRQQKLQMAAVAKLPKMRREFRNLQREIEQLQQQVQALASPRKSSATPDERAA